MTDNDGSNVVHMGAYAKSRSALTRKQCARLLADCRDRVAERLAVAVSAVMPKVDDALFDLADKAVGIGKQTLYFDAMREVRRKREEIEAAFQQGFCESFDAKARGENEATADLDAQKTAETELSLVENDELEESLAVTNAASKIAAACQDGLLALEQRMALLLNKPALASVDNPLAPKLICNAFRTALDLSHTETEIKLIVFKLFERSLAESMKGIYEEVNGYLVERGILPKLPKAAARSQPRSESRSNPDSTPPASDESSDAADALTDSDPSPGYPPTLAAQAPTGADLLAVLQQLLGEHVLRDSLAGGEMGLPMPTASNTPTNPPYAGQPGRVYSGEAPSRPPAEGDPSASMASSSSGVLQALTSLQRGDPRSTMGGTAVLDQATLRSGNVNVLRELKSTEVVNRMSTFDVLTLDVVSMLFDFVLDDRTVPDAMRALIGRLQIPVLKVAMIDRSVFSKKSHPVRRLLDTLARLAVGWDEDQGQNDPLYGIIESVVRRVLESFEEDVGIFDELLGDLEAYASAQDAKALEEEDQAAQAIEARERWTESRAAAGSIVQERLAGTEVPKEVEEFLRDQWREVLAAGLAIESEDDEESCSAVVTMEDLLWSVRPKTTADEQHRLVEELPDLLTHLKEGMALAGMEEEAQAFISELVRLHAAAVNPEQSDTLDPARSSSAERAASTGQALNNGRKEAESTSLTSHPGSSGSDPSQRAAAPAGREALCIVRAFSRANQAIYDAATSRPECSGMGTTLVVAVFSDDRVTIAHVGDSRLYRLRDGQLEQMTVDHSLVERLIAQGFLTREEAKQSNNRNYVTRAMGITADERVDTREEPVLPADVYVLCSDGLSDLVSPDAMRATLLESGDDLEEAAADLLHLANVAGGKDNISVVLARVLTSFAGQSGGVQSLEEKLAIVASTDVGRKRSHNEDSVGFDPALGVAVLADGMGGYNAGEVASSLAVNMMLEELRRSLGSPASRLENERDADGQQSRAGETMLEDLVSNTLPIDTADNFNKIADGLQVGNWVEFRQDNEKSRRARLSWVSPSTGSYLFTDRHGMKVADSTPLALAAQFRNGSAMILENVPLFDRALGSIMSRLKGGALAAE